MKQITKLNLLSILLFASMILFSGCKEDDPSPELTGDSKEFALASKSDPNIDGTVVFARRNDGSTLITIELQGTTAGGSHPAHIHFNTAAEGGAIALTLTPVDGATGKSETVVTTLDDDALVTYDNLVEFDGYVNVHVSASNLSTLIAQGDIGGNELTTTSKTYPLSPVTGSAISGTAKFTKRVNGNALLSIDLTGTVTGVDLVAHIHENTVAESGAVVVDITSVTGATGKSETSIRELNTGTAITYDDLMEFDGYINVHDPSTGLPVRAQGDIGINELTTTSKTYTLSAVSDNTINGTVKFTKRVSGEALVSISLVGTTSGISSPAHIHMGSVANPGAIGISLTAVTGATGKSETSVSTVTYDQLLVYDGYVNVHKSATEMSVLIAQGNIGANEEVTYNVTNSGASSYIFSGGALTNASNPSLTLKRGKTYKFIVNAPNHPFLIKTAATANNTTDVYSNGVTNNDTGSGTVTFTVPANAPNTLYYICRFHSAMQGTITVTD